MIIQDIKKFEASASNEPAPNAEIPIGDLQLLADECDLRAIEELGIRYLKGIGVKQDVEEAHILLAQAANLGSTRADRLLGDYHLARREVFSEVRAAMRWYKRGSDSGDLKSTCLLGRCYEYDYVPSPRQAREYYREAADKGETMGLRFLAYSHLQEAGEEGDYGPAIQYLTKAVEHGDVLAMVELGLLYKQLHEPYYDPCAAARLYRRAAFLGNAEAQFQLALCYENGKGVQQDWFGYIHWMRCAIRQGHDLAIGACELVEPQYATGRRSVEDWQWRYDVGCCWRDADGKEAEKNAWSTFTKLAAEGHADSLCELGLYYNGEWGNLDNTDGYTADVCIEEAAKRGSGKAAFIMATDFLRKDTDAFDAEQAAFWTHVSYLRGYPEAPALLAALYLDGTGVAVDNDKALEFLHQGVVLGDAAAKSFLGKLYLDGKYVAQDKAKAAALLKETAEAGHEGSYFSYSQCLDEASGQKWLEKAVKAGDIDAQLHQAQLHLRWPLAKERKKGRALLRKLSKEGCAKAQFMLAKELLTHSPNTRRLHDEALQWLQEATAAGHQAAEDELTRLSISGDLDASRSLTEVLGEEDDEEPHQYTPEQTRAIVDFLMRDTGEEDEEPA